MKKVIILALLLGLTGCADVYSRSETKVVCNDGRSYVGKVWVDLSNYEYIVREPIRTVRMDVDDCYLENS